jgi:biopolymer transport protein ExbD
MASSKAPKTFSDINITPLTDIFLVLLIIMMVVAPMLQTTGIKLATPAVESSDTVTEPPKTMTVFVASSGVVKLDDKLVPWNRLANEMKALKAAKPDGVLIEVDGAARHEWLAKALDTAQSAGIDKVGVMVAPDDSNAPVAAPQTW